MISRRNFFSVLGLASGASVIPKAQTEPSAQHSPDSFDVTPCIQFDENITGLVSHHDQLFVSTERGLYQVKPR